MDISCRRCGEPWEAYGLRHDMSWHVCDSCGRAVDPAPNGWQLAMVETNAVYCDHPAVTRCVEPAGNGQVPEQVRRWCEQGEPGWLRFVATGLGCPHCHGRQDATPRDLTASELDDLDAATEGALVDWL
jgi:hypothetical protein